MRIGTNVYCFDRLVEIQVWLVVGFTSILLFYTSFIINSFVIIVKAECSGNDERNISNLFNLTSLYLAVLRISQLQFLQNVLTYGIPK